MTEDVLAYLRVSTSEQGDSGLGLEAQRAEIERAAKYRDWRVTEWITDVHTGTSFHRPGLQKALALIENGGPKVLVTAKHDRLSRRAIHLLTLLERAEKHRWAIVMLYPGIDMTTPMGKAMATVMAAFAELEAAEISARTKAALEAAKRRGTRLGRPRLVAPEVVARIVEDRKRGMSYELIARELTADRVPTPKGGAWSGARVRKLVRSAQLDEEAKAAARG